MRISDWSSDVCSSDLESFERIHRSNLVGMGVLPLQFVEGVDRKTLGLTGEETFTIQHVAALKPRQTVDVIVTRADGKTETFQRSEEHTSELQSLMRISYAVFCLKKKTKK